MLNIKIICVGKIKENDLQSLQNEYLKRISRYAKIDVVEIEDEKLPSNLPDGQISRIKDIECKKIKEKIDTLSNPEVFFLDLKGKQYSSEDFATKLSDVATYSSSTIVFVIGGSLGLTDELLSISSNKICFSKMTFPHQLIRIFLLEQIFRAFKIQNNERYHH